MQDKPNKWRLRSVNVAAYTSIALIYHLVFLTHAFQYGRLAGLIPWDDCRFIIRGLRNVDGLLSSPNPLHFILRGGLQFRYPLADVQILAGLVFFNSSFFLTYLLAFVHTLALLLFLNYYFRDSKGFLKYGIMLLSLSLPIVQFIPVFLKTDYIAGMYLLMALLLLFECGYSSFDWKRATVVCAAFTLASLAKLTAFYIPLYCLGVLGLYWLIHLYCAKRFCEYENMQPTRIVFRRCLIISTAFLCTYLIVVLPDIKHYLGHIKQSLSYKWIDEFSLTKHLLYYTPFGVSFRTWSPYWYLLLLFAPLSLLRAHRTQKESFLRLSCLFLATAVLLLPLLVAKVHLPAFGSYFYFAVFGCFLMTVQFLGISFSVKPLTTNFLMAIFWLAIIVCVFFQPKLGHSPYPTEINRKRSEIVTEIARQIHEHGGEREVTWLFSNYLFPPPNLNIKYYQMYHRFLRQKKIDLFQDVTKAVDSADFILALDNPKATYLNKPGL